MMFTLNIKKLLFIAFVLCVSVAVMAQVETGSISGTVADKTGAVVPNAKVTVKAVATGAIRTATTNQDGIYSVVSLQPGAYDVSIEAASFAPMTRRLQVTVGSRSTMDFALAVSGTMTTVEVVGTGGVAVETASQELSQVVNEQQIKDLVTLNRDPYALVGTAGNVASDTNSNLTTERGAGFNINGQRASAANLQLDGAENSDMYGALVGQSVPIDSVQEFRVVTNGLTADYGRTTAGVVNVATKSGTNNFHGSLYEWNRLSTYASNDYNSNAFGQEKARYTRNQFGYSIGGPIKKDKLFFFNNTEWTRIRSFLNQQALVLTPQFIAQTAPTTQAFFNAYGKSQAPASGGVYTVADVLGTVSAAQNPLFAALPSNTPVFQQVNYSVPNDSGGGFPQNTYNIVSRIDYNMSDKTTMYGRYTVYKEVDFVGSNSSSPYSAFNTGATTINHNALLTVTRIWSPSVVTDSKIAFSRLNNEQPLADIGVTPTLYVNPGAAASIDNINVAFPGYLPFDPGSAIPFGGPQNYGQLIQSLNWTKGKHQFKFGGSFLYLKDNHFFGAYENAVEALSNSGWGNSMDNLLTGQVAYFQVAVSGSGKYPCSRDPQTNAYIQTPECTLNLPAKAASFARSNRYRDWGAYAQDTWKITRNFTLNLGLRWEYYGVQHNNRQDIQPDSNFYLGQGNTFIEKIANGYVKPVKEGPIGGLWKPDYNNFAPRVGFAWDIFGDGKTALRGGFGMGYERNFNNVTYNVLQNPPGQLQLSFAAPVDTIALATDNLGPFAGTGSRRIPNVSLRAVKEDIKTSKSYFWNLSIDREIAKSTTLSLAYSGSEGDDLYTIANINRVGMGGVYMGRPVETSRLNLQYGNINYRGDYGFSNYHGLNVGLRSANLLNTGLAITANYTWSHAIDNVSSTFVDGASNAVNSVALLDPFNPELDRGNADFDVRHRLSASVIWTMPFFKNNKGPLNWILGGWEVAPLFTVQTGNPFTVYDCTNAFYTVCPRAVFSSRPTKNSTLGKPLATNTFNYMSLPTAKIGDYWEGITGTGEFPTCPAGSKFYSGCAWPTNMSGRNAFTSPGTFSLDLGVMKNFKVTEGSKLQFRAEMFNVLNHANTYLNLNGANDVYSTVLDDGTPYVSAYKQGRRRIQLALRYSF